MGVRFRLIANKEGTRVQDYGFSVKVLRLEGCREKSKNGEKKNSPGLLAVTAGFDQAKRLT